MHAALTPEAAGFSEKTGSGMSDFSLPQVSSSA